jgi:hypothetical protein
MVTAEVRDGPSSQGPTSPSALDTMLGSDAEANSSGSEESGGIMGATRSSLGTSVSISRSSGIGGHTPRSPGSVSGVSPDQALSSVMNNDAIGIGAGPVSSSDRIASDHSRLSRSSEPRSLLFSSGEARSNNGSIAGAGATCTSSFTSSGGGGSGSSSSSKSSLIG